MMSKQDCKAQTCAHHVPIRLGRALRRGKEDEGRGEEGEGGGENGGSAEKGSRAEWTTVKGNRDSHCRSLCQRQAYTPVTVS
jgi:hypothetical protein